MMEWVSNSLALITGAAVWEGFKLLYPEIKHAIEAHLNAKKQLYRSIDPILKASDELYGKIYSLSNEDFSTLINPENSISDNPELSKKYIYYLFAQFWAQLEYIRLGSQYSSIARIKKGRELLRFIETYESRQHRILDRGIQRIIGESLIEGAAGKFRVMSLNEFIIAINKKDEHINTWFKLLEKALCDCNDKVQRQKILRFGIIVAALIDHFDPNYKIARRRNIYVNKLSKESTNIVNRSIFGHYLTFVRKPGELVQRKSLSAEIMP